MTGEIKLFKDETDYLIGQIVDITGYSDDTVRRSIKKSRIPAKHISGASRNTLRFAGKDLNSVFTCTTVNLPLIKQM